MDNEKQTRQFLGIWIPAELWLNKDLKMQEKIFFIEIQSLDNKNGCFASNRYFSEFFNLSIPRCSAIIQSLKNKGYISIENIKIQQSDSSLLEKRIIKTILKYELKKTDKNNSTPIENNSTPIENNSTPIENNSTPIENDKHINTIINTINNKREREESALPEEILNDVLEEKSEQSKLLSELNYFKNRFLAILSQIRPELSKEQKQKICRLDVKAEDEFKKLKNRIKFDKDNRLKDFEIHAANLLKSTAEHVLNNYKFSFFLKFYEDFDRIKIPFTKDFQTGIEKKEEAITTHYKGVDNRLEKHLNRSRNNDSK